MRPLLHRQGRVLPHHQGRADRELQQEDRPLPAGRSHRQARRLEESHRRAPQAARGVEAHRPSQSQSQRENLGSLPGRLRRILRQEERLLQRPPHQREGQPREERGHPRRAQGPHLRRQQGGEPRRPQRLPAPLDGGGLRPHRRKAAPAEILPRHHQRHVRETQNQRPGGRNQQLPREPGTRPQRSRHQRQTRAPAGADSEAARRPQPLGEQPRLPSQLQASRPAEGRV